MFEIHSGQGPVQNMLGKHIDNKGVQCSMNRESAEHFTSNLLRHSETRYKEKLMKKILKIPRFGKIKVQSSPWLHTGLLYYVFCIYFVVSSERNLSITSILGNVLNNFSGGMNAWLMQGSFNIAAHWRFLWTGWYLLGALKLYLHCLTRLQ